MAEREVRGRQALLSVPGYLTLGKAAKLLGMTGRHASQQLRRMLQRQEEVLERVIMKRGMGTKRPKLFVTMPILWQYCPELFSARDEIVSVVRDELEELGAQVDDLAYRDGVLANELGNVRKRVAKIESVTGVT